MAKYEVWINDEVVIIEDTNPREPKWAAHGLNPDRVQMWKKIEGFTDREQRIFVSSLLKVVQRKTDDAAITDVLRELLMSREEYNEETEAVIVKHMPEKLEMVLSLHERFNR
jgi:hypothetical protein